VKALPATVSAYKRTPTFAQDTIPAGLTHAHKTKAGTWGKIVILEGQLCYRILEPACEEVTLSKARFGVIEPAVLHVVVPSGAVRFYVEFYRQNDVENGRRTDSGTQQAAKRCG
jgi:tellurite resistance-related uncharacterized protein